MAKSPWEQQALWFSHIPCLHPWLPSSTVTFKTNLGNFPGGAVAKSLPANVGNMGSILGPKRFHVYQSNSAHAPQLLRPWAVTTEARAPRPCAPQEKPVPRKRAALALHNKQKLQHGNEDPVPPKINK